MKNCAIILFGLLLLSGCNNQSSNKIGNHDFDVNIDENDGTKSKKDDVVFYNVFSPVDLDNLITEDNAYFNSSLINSINNLTNYTQSHKMALNVGVYGADLSYLWTFEQTQQAISYLSGVQHLTGKLGVPKDFVDFTRESVEEYSHNMDSISNIARDAYAATDHYLRGSDRENVSILILLGGWVETLYIATQIYNKPDVVLASKIATQKYALKSLITRMQNYQNDMVIAEYLVLLKKLDDGFAVFDKNLKPGDIEIDTINKRIVIKETSNLNINLDEIVVLKEQIKKIRNHIVS